jgi:hypothetical protein
MSMKRTLVVALALLCAVLVSPVFAGTKHEPRPKAVAEASRSASLECMTFVKKLTEADLNDTADGTARLFQSGNLVCLGALDLLSNAKSIKDVNDIRKANAYTFWLLAGGKIAENNGSKGSWTVKSGSR